MTGTTPEDRDKIERKWRTKLRRLRFNAEPLEEQVAKYRRVTIVLSVIPCCIAAIILAIFTAFGRPDVGLVGVLILFVPVVSIAWIDHLILARRVRQYLKYKNER